MEMQFKNEINKLADIVVWADGIIRDAGFNEEKYKSDALTAYCCVKAHELWKIRDVALKSMERQTVYSNTLNKDIADKAAKIDLLEKEIEGRKEGYMALKKRMDTDYISIEEHNKIVDQFKKEIGALKEEIRSMAKSRDIWFDTAGEHSNTIIEQSNTIKKLEEKVKHQKENLDGINKTLEIRTKENESLITVKNNQQREIEAHESENARLSEKIIELKRTIEKCKDYDNSLIDSLRINNDDLKEQVEYLKKELEDTYRTKEADLKNHNKRDMALVDELAGKNDEIKSLKEENSYLKSEIKQKQNIIKKAYERYSDEIIKTRKDVLEVAYRDIEKDNGYVGFKLYVKNALIEAKGNKKEANEAITDVVKSCFNEWDKTQKENEKTIEKAIKEVMNKKFGYAWEIAVRLRSEVDKKRIVDISEGAEKILGVSRELFDDAVKALVDDGYREIIGRIPQATNSYVYIDTHVLATPDVETKDAANPENIKSLDSGIPCGSDAIE